MVSFSALVTKRYLLSFTEFVCYQNEGLIINCSERNDMNQEAESNKPRIVCLPNGPYYLFDDFTKKVFERIKNSRGESCETVAGIALCRCGGSNNKPFCDGTHGKIGFSDKNLGGTNPDRRDDYAGKKITIHDNRGICAHAGVCTDNLPSVFRMRNEPWIVPDSAEVQEIIDTIRGCPSGALSYSIDGEEYRDQDREPKVTLSKDGPYCVTGGVELLNVPRGEGASEEHYTLCRCGGSKNKPFCDGTHWHIGFKDDKN